MTACPLRSSGGRLTRPWEQKESTDRGGRDEFAQKLYGTTEESDKLVVERVGQVAKKRGVPQAQIALAWMLHKPYITSPIIGATLRAFSSAIAWFSRLSAASDAESPMVASI